MNFIKLIEWPRKQAILDWYAFVRHRSSSMILVRCMDIFRLAGAALC